MTSLWTKLTVLILALVGLSSLWSIFVLGLDPVTQALGVALASGLAVVAWMETRWGALLVVAVGLVLFVLGIISTTLNPAPEYGPQSGQYLYDGIFLLIAAFSYLSYREIRKRG